MRVMAGRLPLRLSLTYAMVAGAYIVISDRVVAALAPGSPHTTTLQTIKGVAFVCVTAAIMYVLTRRMTQAVSHQSAARERADAVRASLDRRNDAFIKALGEIVYDHDVACDHIDWGGDTVRSLGCTRDELGHGANGWLGRVHPDDQQRVSDEFQRPGSTLFNVEYRMRHGAGHYVWMLDRGVITRDGEQRITRVTGVMWDITERRLAADTLRDSEERFRQLAENIHEVFWLTDVATNSVLYVSPAYERIWARACTDLLAVPTTWMDAIHPDDHPAVTKAVAARARAGDYDIEYRIVRPDGEERWIHDRAFPIRDATGVVYRVAGVAEDITGRKQSECVIQQRLQLERRLSRLAASAPGVIHTFRLEPDGSMSMPYASSELERMTGLSPSDVAASIEPLFSRIHPDDIEMVHASIRESARTMGLWCAEFRAGDPPRSGIWIEGRSAPVLESDGAILWHGFFNDITGRKQLEEQLRQAQKMEAIGQLAGGVAHDFNNLLTIIIGYSDLLLAQLPPDDPSRESVDEIRSAGERSAKLTRQLLAFGRKQVLAPQVLDVNDVIRSTDKMLRHVLGEQVEFTMRLAGDTEHIRADPGQFEQLLLNLVVNAKDAMPNGGSLTIETANDWIDGTSAHDADGSGPATHVRVSVTDTGAGMTDEVKRRLFEPFFTTKTAGKGTGLGLAVAHGFIIQSGGHVEVVSELDHGTTFHMYFPRVDAGASPLS